MGLKVIPTVQVAPGARVPPERLQVPPLSAKEPVTVGVPVKFKVTPLGLEIVMKAAALVV